ncbi:hypothetical protein [Nocardia testacea]|uniref:Uncharacterized protein n=1 Tax=Nocardia testacea TaxID=248551 RepID=A0ABW7VT79_9NOCA
MRRIIETAAVVAAAAVVPLATPLNAHAAVGVFIVQTQEGSLYRLENPENGKCITLPATPSVTNKTDTRATLYETDDCQFAYRSTVEPGDDFYKGGTFFRGVIFGDTTDNDREKGPKQGAPVEPGDGVQDDSPSEDDGPMGDEDPWTDDRPSEGEVG